MKPFRKNVAIAIDGGGIRGVIVTRALSMLERHLKIPVHNVFRLAAGTSTGSIISAGIGAGLTAAQLHRLYISLGDTIFKKSWRTFFWPLTRFRYPHEPLATALHEYIGDKKMGDFWTATPPTDVVITTFDLLCQQDLLRQTLETRLPGMAGHHGDTRLQLRPNLFSRWSRAGTWMAA